MPDPTFPPRLTPSSDASRIADRWSAAVETNITTAQRTAEDAAAAAAAAADAAAAAHAAADAAAAAAGDAVAAAQRAETVAASAQAAVNTLTAQNLNTRLGGAESALEAMRSAVASGNVPAVLGHALVFSTDGSRPAGDQPTFFSRVDPGGTARPNEPRWTGA